MKKSLLVFGAGLLAAAFLQPAQAADLEYERELGLIVSGVVDNWAGIQVIGYDGGSDVVAASGLSGALSIPLGSNLSIQSDVKVEYNSNAFDDDTNFGPRHYFQGAAHLSHRDPSSYLFGIFGGVGQNAFAFNVGNAGTDQYRFIGGEAQLYANDITFYGQGGWIDFNNLYHGFEDGYFGRGVVRWFLEQDTRLQFEALYSSLDTEFGNELDFVSWGARFDTTWESAPIIGSVPIFVAYRGSLRDRCRDGGNDADHTIMIGTSYSFSGTKLEVDRRGATLDTPDFGNYYGCQFPRERFF